MHTITLYIRLLLSKSHYCGRRLFHIYLKSVDYKLLISTCTYVILTVGMHQVRSRLRDGDLKGEGERFTPYMASDSDYSDITHIQRTTQLQNTNTYTYTTCVSFLTHINTLPAVWLVSFHHFF